MFDGDLEIRHVKSSRDAFLSIETSSAVVVSPNALTPPVLADAHSINKCHLDPSTEIPRCYWSGGRAPLRRPGTIQTQMPHDGLIIPSVGRP